MKNISVFDLGWLVGIVEGEGSFSVNKLPRGTYPRFYLYSPDEWVVDKCLRITGMGRKYVRPTPPSSNGKTGPSKAHLYGWIVSKVKEVESLYAELYPHLSPRRQERLLETQSANASESITPTD
jgi:hypothetical protein